MKIFFPLSISMLIWGIIGLIRYFHEKFYLKKRNLRKDAFLSERKKVAVCLPAHNEEDVIEDSIRYVKKIVPVSQIFVVSDGSTDSTAKIARRLRCNVMENRKGKGKSKALITLLKKFNILKNYSYVIFVDADTMIDKNYLKRALKMLIQNPDISAIAAHAKPYWRKKGRLSDADFISSYRTRLYRVLQMAFMYGQTWKYTNVNVVIPGFAAMYRTEALKKLELYTPGIWIEDFNLAFQIHKNKIGKIGYHPNIFATYKDPTTIEDYWSQVRRWNVGFLQTIRAHGMWFSLFWASLLLFNLELFIFSIFILSFPVLIFFIAFPFLDLTIIENRFLESFFFPDGIFHALEIFISLFIFDYLITMTIALRERKYRMLMYGICFIYFQIINSLIFFSSFRMGFLGYSGGKWAHAKRI